MVAADLLNRSALQLRPTIQLSSTKVRTMLDLAISLRLPRKPFRRRDNLKLS